MEKDINIKIQDLLNQGSSINENEVRSLLILIRKRLELILEQDRAQYSTLNLFCNWSAHTAINESIPGLRTLARINDTLVKVKSSSTEEVQKEMSEAIGFKTFHSELKNFLQAIGITNNLSDRKIFVVLLNHLIEIIRDVPIAFLPVGKLTNPARKIYDQIIKNPIKPGAGVISITLSRVDYGASGAMYGRCLISLLVRTEDTTTTIIPLEIDFL